MSLGLLASDAGALERLVVRQTREHTKDDGRSSVELDAHEAMADSIGNVLKVHGRALDEDANGDDGVEFTRCRSGFGCRVRGGGRAVHEREEVGGRDQRGLSLGRLSFAASDQPAVSCGNGKRLRRL